MAAPFPADFRRKSAGRYEILKHPAAAPLRPLRACSCASFWASVMRSRVPRFGARASQPSYIHEAIDAEVTIIATHHEPSLHFNTQRLSLTPSTVEGGMKIRRSRINPANPSTPRTESAENSEALMFCNTCTVAALFRQALVEPLLPSVPVSTKGVDCGG